MGSLRSSFRARRRVPRTLVQTLLTNFPLERYMSIVYFASSAVFGLDHLDRPYFPNKLLLRFVVSRCSFEDSLFPVAVSTSSHAYKLESVLEENAQSNPEARIHPLAHVSVDRAYQAESVGRNSLLSTLFYYSLLSNL